MVLSELPELLPEEEFCEVPADEPLEGPGLAEEEALPLFADDPSPEPLLAAGAALPLSLPDLPPFSADLSPGPVPLLEASPLAAPAPALP